MTYSCKIDFKKEALRYQSLFSSMDNERKIQIENFLQTDDKIRSILSRKLVEHAICHFAKISKSNLSFGTDYYGKPVLLSHPAIHFNVSHCGHWVICAVDKKPVGVDIERIASWNSDTLDMFCNSAEIDGMATVQHPNQRYFQYWTVKEAMLKTVETGLLSDPRKVFVSFLDDCHVIANFNNEIWAGESIPTDDGYILSVINTFGVLSRISVSSDEFYKQT